MIKRLASIEAKFSLSKAAGIVGLFALLSRIIGLLRDRLFASSFGAGDILDTYYAAFRIPDFVFNLLILGTLSVAFIPVFTELLVKDKKRAYKNANTILNSSFILMALVSIVLIILVEPLTKLLVPGFSGVKLEETVNLTRLFLLSPVIFTLSSVFSSILNSQKKFIIVGLAPVLYNLAIILGLLFLYPKYGIMGLGYGVIIGAVLHLLIQIPEAVKHGYSWSPIIDLKDKALKKIGKLFVPRIFGLDNSQISLMIGSIVGSILAAGSVTIFNLANNLQTVPLGVFAISFAIASFPVFSELYTKKDETGFAKTLSSTIVQILFFIIPISILMLIFRAHIVRLAFGAGQFNWSDTVLTFNTLGIFSFSLFSQSLTPLLARAFYARQNTIIPVTINILTMALNAALAYIFGVRFGIVGVAVAFSFASILNALILFLILRSMLAKEQENIQNENIQYFDHKIFVSLVKIILASIIMGLTGYGALYAIGPLLNTHTGFGLLLQSGFSVTLAIGVFFIVASKLKLNQAQIIILKFKSLIK